MTLLDGILAGFRFVGSFLIAVVAILGFVNFMVYMEEQLRDKLLLQILFYIVIVCFVAVLIGVLLYLSQSS